VHQKVKEQIVAHTERDTQLIFRTMHNTARVADNEISRKVVEIERAGGKFEDVRDLVAGARGRRVFEEGDLDAGIWSAGQVQGLIEDIPTCAELISRMVAEAEGLINSRLSGMVA
jgi:NADH:quinone reductase (non-electrogenic)